MANVFTKAWERLDAWGHRKRWAREHERKMRQADGIVVSHTKSGSTWLRVMISHLYHLRYGVPEKEVLNYDNLHRLNPAIPKLHFARDTGTPYFSVFDKVVPAPSEQKILFLLRDPRDVAVSFYFHVLHRAGRRELDRKRISREAVSEMTLYDFVTDEHLGVPRVIGYMNHWWEERSRFSATCLIKYEEMRQDPQAALRKAISFLDREFDETLLRQAVQFADGAGLALLRRADQRAALRAREAQKRPALAPQAELQAVFAEDAVERFLHDPGLLVQQGLAKRRCQHSRSVHVLPRRRRRARSRA